MTSPARTPSLSVPPPRGIARPVEVILAATGLVIAAPIVGLAAFFVKVTSPGPVFFQQERVGLEGRLFLLRKVRTMRISSGGSLVTARGDARVTRVGKILRRTKIDELPQLWNVIRGDMSLVGPRPEVPRYVDRADPIWNRVLRARPGITDPVTLALRDEEAIVAGAAGDRDRFYRERLQPEKLRRYVEYLDRRTAWTDVQVLYRTILAVLLPRGRSGGDFTFPSETPPPPAAGTPDNGGGDRSKAF